MAVYDAKTALEANREFIATVDRLMTEAGDLPSRVAGLLYAGLSLAAQGSEEVGDSGGSATNGP